MGVKIVSRTDTEWFKTYNRLEQVWFSSVTNISEIWLDQYKGNNNIKGRGKVPEIES
jgi:hypothetical protein